ncbi:MAG: hypothetical protein R3F34_09475 [Planctomycetota bacterium]
MLFRRTPSTVLAVALLASSALADGREPGSVLFYPYQGSVLGDVEDEEGEGPPVNQLAVAFPVFNVASVTNTRRDGGGETDVHFQYVNVDANTNPFLFANCSISDRVETLTPADMLSVLTSCHNGSFGASGYLMVSAMDPNQLDTYWSFNHLIGSEYVVTAGGGMFGLNALPFASPLPEGTNTDLDADGRRDFDGAEYEPIPDELYLDSFFGVLPSYLVLASLTGPEYLTNVDFVIFNDDEFQLSAQFAFACWCEVLLADVSGYFTAEGLATTPDDPAALDLDCNGVQDVDTGWAIVRPTIALSITSPNIVNPAVLGASYTVAQALFGGRVLWESTAKQTNGQFPN